ncbi:hypothetical protein DYB36_001865 [Aphanomyces astaci]|uniref:E3 ubiquitin-protein ligase n=1 Tax=Aphanomyces astaci TaxID=112090 RepID=A0A397ANM7_APHAT|nr:hypothetical protein DYB36_001865 [Aphanomyces astaci]
MAGQDAAASEVAEFVQLFFVHQVDSGGCTSQSLLRGLDIMMTCLVDVGGKQKKQAAVTKHDMTEYRAGLRKPRDVMANPVFARMMAKKRRKVCGYIFKADEVAYSCRDCQHDSTCVMCQACFADSNHDGHDVSFQRTSAGGCCDCGDPEAWAKTGFCTKHPGRDNDSTSSGTVPCPETDLPQGLSVVAGPLIDAVVQFLFDALVTSEQGLRVGEGMTSLGSRLTDDMKKQWMDVASTVEPYEDDQELNYDTRLHSDDIHPFSDVIRALRTHTGATRSEAIKLANKSDADGYTQICLSTQVRAVALVVSLDKFTTSVVPYELYDMRRVPVLIEWLRSLCEISDGLAALVSRSIEARRTHPCADVMSLLAALVQRASLRQQSVDKAAVRKLSIDQCLKHRWKVSRDALLHVSTVLHPPDNLGEWVDCLTKKQANSFAWGTLVPGCLGDCLEKVAKAYPALLGVCQETAAAFAPSPSSLAAPAPSMLDILVRNYCLLTKPAIHQVNLFMHELILNQSMKHAMMDAFVDGYAQNTATYLKGLGASSDSIFDFATQLLTVPSLLAKYPKTLVTTLLDALASVLSTSMGVRTKPDGTTCPEFRPDSIAISHSKYKHAGDHLEFVLAHGNPTDLLGHDVNFSKWLQCLTVLQFADAQVRRGRDEPHVEYESDTWFATFNLGIKLHALFPLVLHGLTTSSSPPLCASLMRHVMRAIDQVKSSSLEVTAKSMPALAAGSSGGVASFDATEASVVVMAADGAPRAASSLHIPLHRFVSAMLKQVLVLSKDSDLSSWKASLGLDSLADVVLLLDAPLQCLAMSSQIQANLWRRNGDENMVTQLFNYCAMPYCVNFRDADLFLLQVLCISPKFGVGVLLLGADHVVALVVDRFGLRSYFMDADDATVSPTATYDKHQELQMVDEALRLLLVLSTNVPSSTGSDHEDAFLREELVHQLLVRPSTFSELSDNVSLPLGGQDMSAPIARLEPLLQQVASFQAPVGLEPGKYTIKADSIVQCNPYHMHLNRELHEEAREKILERPNATPPFVPATAPLPHLADVQSLLITSSTVELVKCVLRRRCDKDNNARWTEALVSTALDVLVYGAQVASTPSYWELVAPLIVYLVELERAEDKEHRHVVSWLLEEYARRSPVCAAALTAQTTASSGGNIQDKAGDAAPETDLQARKNQAKARAMAAMAKQMAAFSQLMGDETEEDEVVGDKAQPAQLNKSDDDGKASKTKPPSTSQPPKHKKRGRTTSVDKATPAPSDENTAAPKKWKPTCMLCHDSNSDDELCMVAMVQQSTVLSTGFRPTAADALHPDKGRQSRTDVAALIRAMQLQSRGDDSRSPHFYPNHNFHHHHDQHDHHDHHHESDDSESDDDDDDDEDSEDGGDGASPRMAFADMFWDMGHDDDEVDEFDNPHRHHNHHHNHLAADNEIGRREGHGRAAAPEAELARMLGAAAVAPEEDMARMLGGAFDHAMRMLPPRRQRRFQFNVQRRSGGGPARVSKRNDDDGLNLVPVGLFVRTCQHIVHMKCVDTYMGTLHEKAMRGEEFDGMQAVDGDAPMTQFLCPMCKGLCNVLIPMIPSTSPAPSSSSSSSLSTSWFDIVVRRDNSSWIQPMHQTHANQDTLAKWKQYYEDALWEPHGSFEKGAPYLWSACAYTVASTLAEVDALNDDGSRLLSCDGDTMTVWPSTLEKEYASMQALVTFTRWSFAMVHLTGESKVIYETVKRCCPVVQESKREYKKYTKAFVVSMVAADSIDTIGELIPVFCAADMLQRLGREFFVSEPQRAASFYQDVPVSAAAPDKGVASSARGGSRMQTRRGGSSAPPVVTARPPQDPAVAHAKSLKLLQRHVAKATRHSKHAPTRRELQAVGALQLVLRLCEVDPTLRLKPAVDVVAVDAIVDLNALLVRRMHVVYGCLTDKSLPLPIPPPSFQDVSQVPLDALQTIWEWCVIRKASQMELGAASQDATNRCDHAEHTSEAYLANMFILRDNRTAAPLELVALPTQYDDLYSHHVRLKCQRCDRVPREPGLCLVCGTLLCCGESCCAYSHVKGNPPMGECTRHAFECGGGLGAVLMLQQCRVVLIAGSMVAYFPSPYVDSHGEEDPGLQRGRPLKLDTNRYNMLQALWRSHRLYGEVSRLRNQRDNQQPLNLTYI